MIKYKNSYFYCTIVLFVTFIFKFHAINRKALFWPQTTERALRFCLIVNGFKNTSHNYINVETK